MTTINLFPRVKTPYLIYTPSYTTKSSGVATLHLLCHALNEEGEKAFLFPDCIDGFATNPHLNTPFLTTQERNFYITEGIEPIVVYPDIVRGNPLDAKKVVRYLLAPAGAYGGDKTFEDTDQIWGALPSIAENVLRLPVCDTSIFYRNASSRSGSCYYAHKYEMHGNKLLDITKDSVKLQGTQQEIANILRTNTVCYLYEVSSIITEAALCGCHVILVRTPYFNTIDSDCMMENVSWSDGELAKSASPYGYQEEYNRIVKSFSGNLHKFIEKTQSMEGKS